MNSYTKEKEETYRNFKSLRTIASGFLILYLILKAKALLFIAILIAVVALFLPKAGIGILWVWRKIALLLGWINTRILLSLVFYIVLYPLALLSKIWIKNPLHMRNETPSLYTDRNHTYRKTDLANPW